MKRTLSLFCLIFLLLSSTAFAMPQPTQEFFVNDFANVLSQETKDSIMSIGKSAMEQDGMQLVAAVVPSLEGKTVEDYSIDLARSWGIGSKEKSNGLLILLSTGDRKIRMEVGYGLEGEINDAKAGRLIDDYAISYLKKDDFDMGIRSLYQAVAAELGVTASYPEKPDELNHSSTILIVIFLFILFFFIFTRRRHIFYVGGRGSGPFMGSGSGGFGGGGGFSGGGGSFGGGGASRGF